MAVSGTDLKMYLSGGAGNTNPNLSLGGAKSTTEMGSNIFDNIDASEASAGDTEYRLVYLVNGNATDTAYAVKIYILSNTPSTATSIQIALAGEGLNAQAETVADEGTAPSGETFDDAEDLANALTIGDMAPGDYYGIWIKRTVSASAPSYANDTFTLRPVANTSS